MGQTVVTLKDRWQVTVTPRVYYLAGTEAKKFAIDLASSPLSADVENGPVAPHGLIGQTLDGDDFGVDGKKDNYSAAVVHTSAQGEGAIEGVIEDYIVRTPFDTQFKFTRWGSIRKAHRDVAKLTGGKRHSKGRMEGAAA